MLKLTLARALAASLLGALVILASPGPARAAVFVGSFDPAFGSAFPTLGFRGQGTFLIDDNCLLADGRIFAEDCGGMTLTSAVVNFYNLAAPLVTIESQIFGPHGVDEIIVAAGTITAAQTGLIGPEDVAIPSIYTGRMWLEFRDGFEDDDGPSTAGAYIWACKKYRSTCETPNLVSNVALVTFTRIPEPSSIALVLAAIGIAGVSRRRIRSSSRG